MLSQKKKLLVNWQLSFFPFLPFCLINLAIILGEMFSTSYSRVERNKTSICVLYSVGVIQRTEACQRLGRHIIHGALRKLLFQNLTNIHELISCWQLSGGGSEGIERKAKERTGKTEEYWSQRVSYFLFRTVPIEFRTVPTDFGLLRPFSDRSVRFQTVPSDLGQLHPFSFRVLSDSDTCVPFTVCVILPVYSQLIYLLCS